MNNAEAVEVEKRRKSLDKYLRIVDWGVPDTDEPRARRLIIGEIREALARLETQI